MNKKQLCTIWIALLLLTSMVWFPGRWFDYIIEGYPVIKPDSIEFLVRVFIPIFAFALLISYCLRDKNRVLEGNLVKVSGSREQTLFKYTYVLTIGLFLGLTAGYFLLKSQMHPEQIIEKETDKFQVRNNEFREYCKSEGYRKEIENLAHWLKEKHAQKVAILYNADDAYSSGIYNNFSRKIKDEEIKIVFSDMFKQGERSFYSRLKIIESLKPQAVIFLGTYQERITFLEDISSRSEMAYWDGQLDKIKWIE